MIKISFERTAPPKATRVLVVREPNSEAPADVRKAWVGVEVPLHAPGLFRTKSFPLGKRPKNRFVRWIRVRLGMVERKVGYLVSAEVAIAALSKKDPGAARWYRENVPELLGPGMTFVFDADVCRTTATEPMTGP